MRDYHRNHAQTRTGCVFVNFPQLEQAFTAYREDTSTSKKEQLERAFETAKDAGCTDTTVFKTVGDLLEAIQFYVFLSLFACIISTIMCVTITVIMLKRAPAVFSSIFHSWSKHSLRTARIPPPPRRSNWNEHSRPPRMPVARTRLYSRQLGIC